MAKYGTVRSSEESGSAAPSAEVAFLPVFIRAFGKYVLGAYCVLDSVLRVHFGSQLAARGVAHGGFR